VQVHAARRRDAKTWPQEMWVRENQRRRNKTIVQEPLVAVKIRQNSIEKSGSLNDSPFDQSPFPCFDNQRNWI
jgi:hypothetical protein